MKRFVTEELAMQQDYFWFLACVALLAALAVVIRLGERRTHDWLAWVFGGHLTACLAELVRLAQVVRPPEFGEPNLGLDLAHGGILALQVWALWRATNRGLVSWLVLLVGAGLAALRHPYPWAATLVLVAAATAGLLWRGGRGGGPVDRRLAWALIPTFWFSPIGPGTTALNNWLIARWSAVVLEAAPREEGLTALNIGLRRWQTTGPWGVWTSLLLLAAGVYGLWVLTRWFWSEGERRELRRFVPPVLAWLGVGSVLAAGLGWRVQQEFEAAQKMRVNLAAKLLDREELAQAFGPRYDPRVEAARARGMFATVSREFREAVIPVRRRLNSIQEELPADSFAFVLLERNGIRAVAAVAASFATSTNRVMVLGPEPRPHAGPPVTRFLPPYQEVYGMVTQARAPLHFPDGRFLGWLVLEFGLGEWLAGQTQARLEALAIVGLGFGVALMALRQRLRNMARDEALRAAETARQADQIKTEFLARVSHELRTPIQSVLGYSELLMPAVQGESARGRLAALRQHGLLMLRLVNDLLDLGALQTGRFHLSPRPTRVADLVHQAVESMRPGAEAKGLGFRVAVAGELAGWWQADGERVRQVVLNLVANAIKFTDRGSIDVAFEREGEGLKLTVTDTGPGIAPADAARIFQPFARLEGTAAKEGTGLGLVLARALCESMGGGLVLEPREAGARFVARLQLDRAAAPPETSRPAPGALRGRTILVVDDNTLIRELFSTYLQELGADCTVAADGRSALELAAARRYDVVILDLALPGMGGTAVARKLRRTGSPGPRILGVSAHASADERAQALAAGMDVFLPKPVDLRALVEAMDRESPPAEPLTPALAGLQERLRAQFRGEAPVIGAALESAVAEADWAAVGARAHYLKNSADVLGLRELAEHCRELESAAARNDTAAMIAGARACQDHLRRWS